MPWQLTRPHTAGQRLQPTVCTFDILMTQCPEKLFGNFRKQDPTTVWYFGIFNKTYFHNVSFGKLGGFLWGGGGEGHAGVLLDTDCPVMSYNESFMQCWANTALHPLTVLSTTELPF